MEQVHTKFFNLLKGIYNLTFEHITILNSLFWGFWSIYFDNFSKTPLMSGVVEILSRLYTNRLFDEWLIGGLMIVSAIIQLVGFSKNNWCLRIAGARLGFVVFSFVGGLIVYDRVFATSAPLYIVVSLCYLILSFKLVGQHDNYKKK